MRIRQSLYFMSKVVAILALAGTLASTAWAGPGTFILYSFSGSNDGGDPASALVFDSAGNAYGTTVSGGDFGFGTVFELTPVRGGWTETVLYSFTGSTDGKNPHGGVTLDSQGNLYGTTVAGGDGFCTGDGCGVVFKLTNSGGVWTESVIHSFTDDNKGFGPGGQVVFDKAGNLYGETPDGGKSGAGTIYQLTPTQNGNWKHVVIHHFTGGKDGAVGSLGALLLDHAGNLYGVTEVGGANGAGTVFKVSPKPDGSWKLNTLYSFQGMPDAGFPYGGLIFDAKRNLYGTTYFGGANGMGAVYELTRTTGAWTESVLYSFKGGKDGSLSTSTLVFRDGNLFGTTSGGGNLGCDCGTIFKLARTQNGWKETIPHRFTSVPDGAYAYYGLTYDGVSSFYGTTVNGGVHNQGTVFQFVP